MEKQLTEEEMRQRLFAQCLASTKKVAAKDLGFSPQYIGNVIRYQLPVTERLAERMGYERRVVFVERRITCADVLQDQEVPE